MSILNLPVFDSSKYSSQQIKLNDGTSATRYYQSGFKNVMIVGNGRSTLTGFYEIDGIVYGSSGNALYVTSGTRGQIDEAILRDRSRAMTISQKAFVNKGGGELDVFDGMAGGRTYDEFFAGGVGALGFGAIGANLASIKIPFNLDNFFLMTLFNEDYVERVLMPNQQDDRLSDDEINVLIEAVAHGLNVGFSKRFNLADNEGKDYFGSGRGVEPDEIDHMSLKDMFDDRSHSTAVNIGTMVAGPIGGIIGGMLYGGFKNGMRGVKDSFTVNVVSTFAREAIGGIVSAFGVKSMAMNMAISFVAFSVIQETVEVALGLDNHFGPGGEVIGKDQHGESVYGRAKSWGQYFKEQMPDFMRSMLGLSYTAQDAYSSLETNGMAYGLTGMDAFGNMRTDTFSMDAFGNTINLSASQRLGSSSAMAAINSQAMKDASYMNSILNSMSSSSNRGPSGNSGIGVGDRGGPMGGNVNGTGATGGSLA